MQANATVTIEEMQKMDSAERFVLDIRSEDACARGTVPGAVNLPLMRTDPQTADLSLIPGDRPVCVLCQNGLGSGKIVSFLRGRGLDARNVEGGYRAYLRRSLEEITADEGEIARRRARAQRTIIKGSRKTLWSRFTRAVRDYHLIEEGDRIAVCISGGKDSMLLARLMEEIRCHGKIPFELEFLCMDPGYHPDNRAIIELNARLLGIPLTAFETPVFDVAESQARGACYLCARMRRGYLYARAKALGCNKIALGHHYDDVIETILMGMLYAGKVETMLPRLRSQNFEGMQLIRPLYLIREKDIRAWARANDLHFLQCACHFTERGAEGDGEKLSKRNEVKELIGRLEAEDPSIPANIFNSVTNINLWNVIGYHLGEDQHSFLDRL